MEYLSLADEVRRLAGFDHWLHIFDIVEPIYRDLTLEVLRTFEIDSTQAKLRCLGGIRFQVHGEQKSVNFANFVEFVGIYKEQFTTSIAYP